MKNSSNNAQPTTASPTSLLTVMHEMGLVTVLAASIAGCSGSDEASEDTASSPEPHALVAPITDILQTHHADREFPGGVVAVEGPDGNAVIVTVGTVGAEPESAPVDPAVPWAIGSITKTFVSVVILQLVEEGTLTLDDSIEPYYPDAPRATDITIRHLLQSSSGLSDYVASPEFWATASAPWTPDELIAAAVALGPVSEPGEEHHYSNAGYIMLAKVIEDATGKPWDAQIRERIVDVLGLKDTGYAGDPDMPPLGPGFGNPDGEFVSYDDHMHYTTGYSAGGLQSTASDLLIYTQALFEGALLQEESLAEMSAFMPGEDYGFVDHEYGLGLEKYSTEFLTIFGHLGSASAHTAFIAYNYESETAVAVLLNIETGGPAAFVAMETVEAALELGAQK